MAFDPKKIKFPKEEEILDKIEKIIDKEIKDEISYDPLKVKQECMISCTLPKGFFNIMKNNLMIFNKIRDAYLIKGWRDFKINEEHSCLHDVELYYYFD